jgi:hypothetical protein
LYPVKSTFVFNAKEYKGVIKYTAIGWMKRIYRELQKKEVVFGQQWMDIIIIYQA